MTDDSDAISSGSERLPVSDADMFLVHLQTALVPFSGGEQHADLVAKHGAVLGTDDGR